jgi:anti-anti-sigma regulatory factor
LERFMTDTAHKLTVQRDDQPGRHVLILAGQIDEHASLVTLAPSLRSPVVVDLEGVTFINSLGVRAWVDLLEALRARGIPVTLARCSEAMVDQMNVIMEVRGHAKIESFYAPYTCTACGLEERGLLQMALHGDALARARPPQLPCPSCRGAMSYDDIPARALLFLE